MFPAFNHDSWICRGYNGHKSLFFKFCHSPVNSVVWGRHYTISMQWRRAIFPAFRAQYRVTITVQSISHHQTATEQISAFQNFVEFFQFCLKWKATTEEDPTALLQPVTRGGGGLICVGLALSGCPSWFPFCRTSYLQRVMAQSSSRC